MCFNNNNFMITVLAVLSALTVSFSAEKLLCGFEQDEMATWPLSINSGKGDTNEIVYTIPYTNGILTQHTPAVATQGTWTLYHEIFAVTVPGNQLFRRQAYRYQSWAAITSEQLFDSTRANVGEWLGPLDWGTDRFGTLFSLFHTLDKLPADLQDWSAYDYVYFDVKTTTAEITLKVSLHGKYRPSQLRFYKVAPGQFFTLCVPIKDMDWVSRLDLSDLKDFKISLRDVKGVTQIYIDNIRLVTKDVAPVLPLVTDNRPLEPWLLTSIYKPPVASPPTPAIMNRVTGPVAAAPPATIVEEAATPYRNANYLQGIAPFDNVKYGIIERFKGYQYWSSPPEPNASPGGDHSGRAWIGSVDGGQTWRSDSVAGQNPLLFTATMRGTLQAWGFGDNLLRGAGYFITQGWCADYAPGDGVAATFYQFYKIVAQNDKWVVYPDNTFQKTPPQLPPAIIVSDISRMCGGSIKATVLPSGRIWAAYMGNHLNPTKGYWGLYASYSDDGGMRWQYPLGKRSGVWANGQDESVVCESGPVYAVPYENQVMCLTKSSGIFYYTLGDGNQWTTRTPFANVGWDGKSVSAVNYKDSTVFLCCGNASGSGSITLYIFKNGVTTSKTVVAASQDSVSNALMTLCGERLWIVWRNRNEKSLCCIKYFINPDRFSSETTLVQSDSLVYDATNGVCFKLASVSPPSHVPLVYCETVNGKNAWKLLRVPIDSEEAVLDPDYDGLENTSETAAGTASDNPDSDGDGLWDGQEVVLLGTNPKNVDTDNDGDNDALEFYSYTDPRDAAKTTTHNQAPAVSLAADSGGGGLRLDASGTTDAESDYLRYFWDIELKSGETLHAEGDRIICQNVKGARLTVDDGRGNQSAAVYGDPLLSEKKAAVVVSTLFTVQPNPFTQKAIIQFTLACNSPISLKIFNLQGRLVKELRNGDVKAGHYQATWEPTRGVTSGLYYAILKIENRVMTGKLIYLK
ncbi:MAG: T9SS type A sorting domain-containing protein [Fibrobacterota bacterium]